MRAPSLVKTKQLLVIAAVAAGVGPSPSSPVRAAPIEIVVVSVSGLADAQRVRAAIGRELGVTCVAPGGARAESGTGTVTVDARPEGRTLTVSFRRRHVVVTRTVALPSEPSVVESSAVILAGNVARDEARDVLGALKKAAPADPQSYAVRLADLERRIDGLKNRIRERHAAPAETPFRTPLGVTIRSHTTATFVLERARVVVDGVVMHDGPVIAGEDVEVLRFVVPEGVLAARAAAHEIAVALVYRLRDPIFTYVSGYKLEVSAARTFEGRGARDIGVVVREQGGATTQLGERLRVDWP